MYPVLPSTNTRHHVHSESANSQRGNGVPGGKRNSNMIFRIEQFLPNTIALPDTRRSNNLQASTMEHGEDYQLTSSSTSAKRTKLPPRSGVYVAQFTPKDTRSETYSTLSVMSTTTNAANGASSTSASTSASQTAYCNLSNGTLCMTPAILRKIKLSEDIHSYNALFEIHNGNVRVHVIRDIASDDELVAWFGEEATLLMSIPFLTPLNIQGNNRYTCHQCHLTFETPNPLKIHLALGCGRHSMDILWIRLHYALKAKTFGQQLLPGATTSSTLPLSLSTFNTTRSVYLGPQTAPHNPTTASTSSSFSPPSNSPQRLSAFKPITSIASANCPAPTSISSVTACSSLCTTHTAAPMLITTTASTSSGVAPPVPTTFMHTMHATSHVLPPHISLLQPTASTHPLNAAAQIEAIVSNMGASKQGHLCIYCGKVYSRKYGLKIHIRTHTGFKPLKCKFCLRPFGDPSNLNKHVRLHMQASSSASMGPSAAAPIEGYKCQLCHKTLARRRDLQRHMESRHGETAQRVEKAQRPK